MRVAGVYRYPVKSMQGEQPPSIEVDEHGVVGDRRYGVLDVDTGRILSAKEEPRLLLAKAGTVEGGVEVEVPDGADLGAWLGRRVELREAGPSTTGRFQAHLDALDETSETVEWDSPPGAFLDESPVHLLTTASLRAMAAAAPAQQWDVRRFRPNLLLDIDADGFVEDEWMGSRLRVGPEVVLEVFKPTTRCSMTGRAQPDGVEADREVMRALHRHHRFKLGVHARVLAPGRVEPGARVERVEG